MTSCGRPYCFQTIFNNRGQPLHVTVIEGGGTQAIYYKTRINLFETDIFQIPILLIFHWKNVHTVLIANIMFCSLKLFSRFSGGSLKVRSGTLNYL